MSMRMKEREKRCDSLHFLLQNFHIIIILRIYSTYSPCLSTYLLYRATYIPTWKSIGTLDSVNRKERKREEKGKGGSMRETVWDSDSRRNER